MNDKIEKEKQYWYDVKFGGNIALFVLAFGLLMSGYVNQSVAAGILCLAWQQIGK